MQPLLARKSYSIHEISQNKSTNFNINPKNSKFIMLDYADSCLLARACNCNLPNKKIVQDMRTKWFNAKNYINSTFQNKGHEHYKMRTKTIIAHVHYQKKMYHMKP